MATCDLINLGSFSHCDEVVIPAIDGECYLLNVVTRRLCAFEDGSFGYLSIGCYILYFGNDVYKFSVDSSAPG